ncbi:MFS transporter [Alsobacter metallidurans]|uniref:MFS transporter n=1 Tax=Alsobacter metallidurans TaxID=340221 RepID=A0A917MFY5_9HYPH|nr:MFS transporter [Alsobacter metallidurans]GGH06981.1 MFS transporter [Alsobacter metallidurans]
MLDKARETQLLAILGLSGFASSFAARSTDPMVNAIAADFSAPVATVALLSSCYALPYGLGQPVLGPLGDAISKGLVLRVCLVVFALALGAGVFAGSLEQLFVSRVVAGLAAGGVIPLALAMVGDAFAYDRRQVAISRFLAAALIGQLVGVTASGAMADWVGWRGAMAVTASAALIALVATLLGLPAHLNARAPGRFSFAEAMERYRLVFANPRAKICYGAVFLEGVAIYGVLPFVPELLQARGGGGATQAGLSIAGIGLGGILFSATVSLLLRRFPVHVLMRAGGVIGGLGLAGVAYAATWPALTACFGAVGFGFFMLHNSLQNRATELAPTARGSAIALHAFFFFIGQALAPPLFGVAFHTVGAPVALAVCAIVLAATGVATGSLLNRHDMRDGTA